MSIEQDLIAGLEHEPGHPLFNAAIRFLVMSGVKRATKFSVDRRHHDTIEKFWHASHSSAAPEWLRKLLRQVEMHVENAVGQFDERTGGRGAAAAAWAEHKGQTILHEIKHSVTSPCKDESDPELLALFLQSGTRPGKPK